MSDEGGLIVPDNISPDFVAWNARQSLAAAISTAAAWLQEREVKTISQIVNGYNNRLTNIVKQAFKTGDAVEMRRAHKALLKNVAFDAYRDGMREGGIAEPDQEDRDVMDEAANDWVAGQVEFVNQFAKDAAASKKDKDKRDGILARIDLWVAALRNFGEAGKLYALGNIPLTFDGEDGEESCDDCQRYKGQRHRRNWWADRGLLERDGNPNYECGRWPACHHSFKDDSGKVIVT
jgi:hypothetical protein